METNGMTPEKSLELISDAIARSRRDFERNSGTPMILWGTVVFVFSVALWIILKHTGNPLWNFLWFAVPLVGWPLSHFCIKESGTRGARNFINETIAQVWIGYGIFATAVAAALAFIIPQHIGPVLIALLGYGAFMTGMILRNRYIAAGGILTGAGGAVALSVLGTYDATLVFTAAAIVSLIVPGMMMNRKASKSL